MTRPSGPSYVSYAGMYHQEWVYDRFLYHGRDLPSAIAALAEYQAIGFDFTGIHASPGVLTLSCVQQRLGS